MGQGNILRRASRGGVADDVIEGDVWTDVGVGEAASR